MYMTKKFIVKINKEGALLQLLRENKEDLRIEEYQLRDGEIIELEGDYPIIKRF